MTPETTPYTAYRHLLSSDWLTVEDREMVKLLWNRYRKADKRAKRLEHEKESNDES